VLKTGNLNRGFISIHILMILFACVLEIGYAVYRLYPKIYYCWLYYIYVFFPIVLDIVLCVIILDMQRFKSYQRSIRFVASREERRLAKIQARENELAEVRRSGYKQEMIDAFLEDHPSVHMSN
jgi:hypothetical protein